ncbi:MAG: membrane protein insertion efficiency factor YidD [Verrucomicrobiota bacterium]|nr:membrane protein insertion efficiency factor YidD [Verrucomicrobiota bacterium]
MVAAVALAAAAIFDWTRPPARQVSVAAYRKLVLGSYRTLVRPATSHLIRCPFQPTCSAYSEEAMRRFGFPKGLGLSITRLMRCMPWVPVGTPDPVPAGIDDR